jgi:hypothetical protein
MVCLSQSHVFVSLGRQSTVLITSECEQHISRPGGKNCLASTRQCDFAKIMWNSSKVFNVA